MAEATTTRASLLIRLRDNADADAWSQFVEIYSPLIFSFARRCGLQESDAADIVQDVMREVTGSIGKFEYDPNVGKFRSWLYKIAKRTMYRVHAKRKKQPVATGDSQTLRLLQEEQDTHNEIQQFWDDEYQQNLLQWAADHIRTQFQATTWDAFWKTSVEGMSAQQVADELDLSVGAVYVAKSRVTKRLAEKIKEVDDSQ